MYPDEIRSKPIDEREPMNNTEKDSMEEPQEETIVVRPATENYEAMSFDYSDVSIRNKFENWLQKSCTLVISNEWTLLVHDTYGQLPVKLGNWVVYDRLNDVISVMSHEEFSRDWVRV